MSTETIVILTRNQQCGEDCILGTMTTNRGTRLCSTLELRWRANEINVSCIPAGEYRVERYVSGRFGDCFRLLDEQTAPRTQIRIHAGNYSGHTRGCILPGSTVGVVYGRNAVLEPKETMAMLRETLPDSWTLRIVDGPGLPNTKLW